MLLNKETNEWQPKYKLSKGLSALTQNDNKGEAELYDTSISYKQNMLKNQKAIVQKQPRKMFEKRSLGDLKISGLDRLARESKAWKKKYGNYWPVKKSHYNRVMGLTHDGKPLPVAIAGPSQIEGKANKPPIVIQITKGKVTIPQAGGSGLQNVAPVDVPVDDNFRQELVHIPSDDSDVDEGQNDLNNQLDDHIDYGDLQGDSVAMDPQNPGPALYALGFRGNVQDNIISQSSEPDSHQLNDGMEEFQGRLC